MHGLAALSAGVITSLRAEWFRVRLDRTHLRLFCGRLIVMTLEGRHAWLALSEELLDAIRTRGGYRVMNARIERDVYWVMFERE